MLDSMMSESLALPHMHQEFVCASMMSMQRFGNVCLCEDVICDVQ